MLIEPGEWIDFVLWMSRHPVRYIYNNPVFLLNGRRSLVRNSRRSFKTREVCRRLLGFRFQDADVTFDGIGPTVARSWRPLWIYFTDSRQRSIVPGLRN